MTVASRTPAERPVEPGAPASEAALKLVRTVLPGWNVEAHKYEPHDAFWVAIWPADLRPERCYEGRAETLELAILTAALLALRDATGARTSA